MLDAFIIEEIKRREREKRERREEQPTKELPEEKPYRPLKEEDAEPRGIIIIDYGAPREYYRSSFS